MNPDMLRQLQQMQAQISKAQQELEESTVEASAGGGAVTVVVSGHPKIESIRIAAEAVDPDDVEMLQDLIAAALNEALEKVRTMQLQRLGGLAGGLNIPGLT
ncbi:MAG: YbaB/EbfC family nucleoid-associated protein [Chloroflexota bacterium]|nr:YbaB/EbfC family nucleoid-associated protein [Chloroflexota bacterium]